MRVNLIYDKEWLSLLLPLLLQFIIQFNSILYVNVLTQQLQEPITESAQEDKYIHSKEIIWRWEQN
jgi:hypothetical protein